MGDKVPLSYRLFGWWIRWQACKMAAQVMSGRGNGEEPLSPLIWSITVFFEKYICDGANATADDFGPKEPVALNTITTENDHAHLR